MLSNTNLRLIRRVAFRGLAESHADGGLLFVQALDCNRSIVLAVLDLVGLLTCKPACKRGQLA